MSDLVRIARARLGYCGACASYGGVVDLALAGWPFEVTLCCGCLARYAREAQGAAAKLLNADREARPGNVPGGTGDG